jgi:hypothetical protein
MDDCDLIAIRGEFSDGLSAEMEQALIFKGCAA